MMIKFLLFTAIWSKSSQEMIDTIKTFLSQFLPGVEYEEVEITANPKMHGEYAIRVYPTVVKLVDGVEVARKAEGLDLIGLVEFMK